MEYENLWDIPSEDSLNNTTENVSMIMKQQAEHLKIGTHGKVMGKFSKINDFVQSLAILSTTASAGSIDDNEIKQLTDANRLYRAQRFGFEIYNQTYRFRILEIILTPLYPITICIDEGVLEDTKSELWLHFERRDDRENQYIINSDDDLLGCLKTVFSSKKVKYILYKLQQTD